MKENTEFLPPSYLSKIIYSCMWIWFLGIFIHTCGAVDDDGRLNQVIDSSLQMNAGKVYFYEQTLPQNDAELLKPLEQGNPNPLESISLLKTRHAIEIEELRKRQELRNEKGVS